MSTDRHRPLHLLLSRQGMSQAAFAAWCGVSQPTISRVLAGTVKPSLRVVAGAMDMFGAERPEELFDPDTLTARVRYWTTPHKVAAVEAARRTAFERVRAGGQLPA